MQTLGRSKVDLLLVNASGKKRVYQALADELAAFEPPIWALLLASHVRRQGFSVAILDAEALQLTAEETVRQIVAHDPLLAVFTVYGQQPSASTQCMPATGDVCRTLKAESPAIKTMFIGTHPSALAERTLREEAVDFVCEGEGAVTIVGALRALRERLRCGEGIPGLWYRRDGSPQPNARAKNLTNLDEAFPEMPWELVPMDCYKAHNWHCWDHIHERKPYSSLYTSLGCPYKCSFCCINAPFGDSGIRYFSPDWVIRQIDVLVQQYGVKNIKFADEMFVLNPQHVLGIADRIIERGYDLNIWAYARVDTVKDRYLERLKQAGFNWLGIGVESGSKFVRDGVEKGRFGDDQIREVITKIREYGINVGANYIFGLPDDTLASMCETRDLALSLNTEYANFYCAMAYPGSPLHESATRKHLPLPEDPDGPGWIGYSQHAYETYNLPTDTIQAGAVLSFRDSAFDTYFTNPSYLDMIGRKFGQDAVDHIRFMTSHKLERKYALPLDCQTHSAAPFLPFMHDLSH